MNRAEATATADTSPPGGVRPGRAQVSEAPVWSVCGEMSTRELQWRGHCVAGCFVLGLDGFNEDEYKKSSEQRKPDTKPL